MEQLGISQAHIEDAPDQPGVELQFPDELTDITGLEPGDDVTVKHVATGDGNTKLVLEFPDLDLTDEQKNELENALQ